MKQKFDILTSTCIPLPLENVDTDQIIPARFLKATTREEKFFGDNLFRDWRYHPDGTLNKDFVRTTLLIADKFWLPERTSVPVQAVNMLHGQLPDTDSES